MTLFWRRISYSSLRARAGAAPLKLEIDLDCCGSDLYSPRPRGRGPVEARHRGHAQPAGARALRARAGAAPLKPFTVKEETERMSSLRARAGAAPLKPLNVTTAGRIPRDLSAPARARPR